MEDPAVAEWLLIDSGIRSSDPTPAKSGDVASKSTSPVIKFTYWAELKWAQEEIVQLLTTEPTGTFVQRGGFVFVTHSLRNRVFLSCFFPLTRKGRQDETCHWLTAPRFQGGCYSDMTLWHWLWKKAKNPFSYTSVNGGSCFDFACENVDILA